METFGIDDIDIDRVGRRVGGVMEWFDDIPPRTEWVEYTNETIYENTVGVYTYALKGRAGRWYVERRHIESISSPGEGLLVTA